ncbi:type II toxin-antitoxin system HicB family antitoxin [Sphaerotilus mobilis]|nr:type II toxin-antitoxin system HicB family antitoxin [Sphaerotilus mobilis]
MIHLPANLVEQIDADAHGATRSGFLAQPAGQVMAKGG